MGRARGPTKRRPKKQKYALWGAIAIATALVAVFIAFALKHRADNVDSSSLENGLSKWGYSPFQPPRDDLSPGAMILLDEYGQELVLSPQGLGLSDPESGNAPDYKWRVAISTDGKFRGDIPGIVGNLAGTDASEAEVTLKDVRIVHFPLKALADAVRAHPTAVSEGAKKNSSVVVLSEVLIAGSLQIEFRTNGHEKIDLSTKQKSPGFLVDGGFRIGTDGRIVSERPMPIGFKAHRIGGKGLDFAPGDAVAAVSDHELTPAEVVALRGADSKSSAKLSSEYQLFALCVGLGNHPAASLDGAAPSADRVADSLRSMLPAEQAAHVEVRTTRAPGGAATTELVTKAKLLQWVNDFVDHQRRAADPSRQAIVLFYFLRPRACRGHIACSVHRSRGRAGINRQPCRKFAR